MPTILQKQIKIWFTAWDHLRAVSDAHKVRGESSASMTSLASHAILQIPMPNGNGKTLVEVLSKEEECPTES